MFQEVHGTMGHVAMQLEKHMNTHKMRLFPAYDLEGQEKSGAGGMLIAVPHQLAGQALHWRDDEIVPGYAVRSEIQTVKGQL
eukprot:5542552-Karenia_brevis.AAC.1